MLSYQNLEKSLGFEKKLPVTKDWSAAPDFLKLISDFCLENNPGVIVECSSGTSSLVLSRCCQLNQHGHVYSLENAEEFVAQSQRQLNDFLLSAYSDVIHAPLRDVMLNGGAFQWYDLAELPEIKIDLLVIDGPPGFLQKHSRYPALPLLYDLLAKHCVIFLDDAARKDEQELVGHWLQAYPEFQSEYIENERGCFVLKR
jgi:predicted O-methyltransferase YrrM